MHMCKPLGLLPAARTSGCCGGPATACTAHWCWVNACGQIQPSTLGHTLTKCPPSAYLCSPQFHYLSSRWCNTTLFFLLFLWGMRLHLLFSSWIPGLYVFIFNKNIRILVRWVKAQGPLSFYISLHALPQWWNAYFFVPMVCCFLITPINVVSSPNLHYSSILNIIVSSGNCLLKRNNN